MPTFFRIDEPSLVIGGRSRDSGHKMKYTTKPGSDGSDSSGSLGEVSPTRTGATEQPLSPTYSVKSEGSSPVHRSQPYDTGSTGRGVQGIIQSKDSPKDKKYKQKKPKLKSAGSSPAHDVNSWRKAHMNSSDSSHLMSHAVAAVVVEGNVPEESQVEKLMSNSEQSQSEVSDVLSDRESSEASFSVVTATDPVQNGFILDDAVNSNVNNDNNVTSGISNTSNLTVGSKLQNCDFQVEEFTSEPRSPRKSLLQNSKPPETVVTESVQLTKNRQSPKHKKTKSDKTAGSTDKLPSEEVQGQQSKNRSPNREGHYKKHRSPKHKKGHSTLSPNKLKFLEGDDDTPPPPYSASASSPTRTLSDSGPSPSGSNKSAVVVTQETPVKVTVVSEVSGTPTRATTSEEVSKSDLPYQMDMVPTGSGPSSPDSDTGSIYHQPLKDVDLPSAQRLAKRLYDLDGFKKQDISKHLSKKYVYTKTLMISHLIFILV